MYSVIPQIIQSKFTPLQCLKTILNFFFSLKTFVQADIYFHVLEGCHACSKTSGFDFWGAKIHWFEYQQYISEKKLFTSLVSSELHLMYVCEYCFGVTFFPDFSHGVFLSRSSFPEPFWSPNGSTALHAHELCLFPSGFVIS